MTTTLNLSLSADLQTTLGQSGVWAYAYFFDKTGGVAIGDPKAGGGNEIYATLVDDGAVQMLGSATAGEFEITLPTSFDGGKIYFLIQSQAGGNTNDLTSLITQQSEINWGNAETWDFRYDSFEVTLSGGTDDAGNLTSVNGFGIPMALSVEYSDGTSASRGYDVSGDSMFTSLSGIGDSQTVYTYSAGPLKDDSRIAISPAEAVGLDPPNTAFAADDWSDYVDSLKVADPDVAIAGFFNGAADAKGVYHNPGYYAYELEWDSSASVFWLSPTGSSEIKGHIQITADNLENSIYSTLGNVSVYTNKTDAEPYEIFDHPFITVDSVDYTMNSGENNEWGAVLAQFLTGFTAGYYGQTGDPVNPLVTDGIDLGQNWNWDPSYAFGHNIDGSAPAYQYYDPYSEAFFFTSNSYGSGYTDNLMNQYAEGGPLLTVSDPGGGDVSEINLTLFDDSETPTGYTEPVIYNYTPPGSGYLAVDSTSSPNNIVLDFTNAEMVLADGTPVSLRILTGSDPSSEASWQTVEFTGDTLWQNWTISNDGGTYSVAPQDPQVLQPTGSMLIANFPSAGEAGTAWFQIEVGAGASLKTYNLYTEMSAPGGGDSAFLNPLYSGQAGSIAIDGLALVSPPNPATPPETINTFSVDFLYSTTSTIHPDLLTHRVDTREIDGQQLSVGFSSHGLANAPVAGTVAGGAFTAIAGQSNQVSNSATTTQAEVAFGWTGLNSAAGTPSWISGYTNKVGAQNTAGINLELDGHPAMAPVTAQADIDGAWQTKPTPLGNGTYTVTMTETLPDGTPVAMATTPPPDPTYVIESSALTLTVDVAELALAAADGGRTLELLSEGAGGPDGNWVSLDALGSTAAPGTTLLIYATNTEGERVSRDGEATGAGVSFDEATLAAIGAAHADGGDPLLFGNQAFYLETGLELNFAVLSGNGVIDTDPDISIGEPVDGILGVTVGDFVLGVETDNTLTGEEVLGQTQRVFNDELLYLEQGTTLEIELAGSCANTNTLGFVRFEIDDVTGDWSVGGVDYGDTDAFRDAVLDNLDDGFVFHRGGQFEATEYWTVDGEDGFYAPVLVTESDDVFVIGDAHDGGHEYIRMYGHNTFGFEDLTAAQGSDFDFNDMVMRIAPAPGPVVAPSSVSSSSGSEPLALVSDAVAPEPVSIVGEAFILDADMWGI